MKTTKTASFREWRRPFGGLAFVAQPSAMCSSSYVPCSPDGRSCSLVCAGGGKYS